MVARARPTAARSTTRAALTCPSPVLVAQVAEDPRPQEHERQPALPWREHDLLARVALCLAQDVIEPALEGHHVLGPAAGRPHARRQPGPPPGDREPARLHEGAQDRLPLRRVALQDRHGLKETSEDEVVAPLYRCFAAQVRERNNRALGSNRRALGYRDSQRD